MANKSNRLPDGVADLHVYLNCSSDGTDGVSALVVTSDGDVYGLGINSLVDTLRGTKNEYPMQENGDEFLKEWVKVDSLCGLGIKKIVIGCGSGAAVTNDNAILTWGDGPASYQQMFTVMLQEHDPLTKCRFCEIVHSSGKWVGNLELSYCPIEKKYSIYGQDEIPPSNVRVRRVAFASIPFYIFCVGIFSVCSRCMVRCAAIDLPAEAEPIKLNYCTRCKRIWEVEENTFSLGERTASFVRKLEYPGGFRDVAPGGWGFWCLTESNCLLWSGYFTHRDSPDAPSWWKSPLVAPNKIISVQSSETDLFVLTADKKLYKRTMLTVNDQNTHMLTHISFGSPVMTVSSGISACLCLLESGEVMMFPDASDMIELVCDGQPIRDCLDVLALAGSPILYVQTKQFVGKEIEMKHPVTNKSIFIVFNNLNRTDFLISDVLESGLWPPSFLQYHQSSEQGEGARHIPGPSSAVALPQFLSDLYGKTLFADLTLQLADGDFPAHRAVLCLTSKYFRDKLTSTPDLTTLDLRIYNPNGYRCLLQHIYQVQPDDLDEPAQLDLLLLATSYGEEAISNQVLEGIKSNITADNVARVMDFSKKSGLNGLAKDCEDFMRSDPAYKEMLLSLAIENLPMLVASKESNAT